MNILMALSQLEVTGAEIYAVTIADELISRGNQVYIISDTLSTKTKAQYIKLEFNKRNFFNRLKHIKVLYKFIKEKDIQIVHAHSRASSWSCQIACKLANIPLITTTHGRQPVHFSRKLIKGFGDYTIAVCENIKKQLINELGFDEKKISVLSNPINFIPKKLDESILIKNKKIISIIGRLSGPKGEVTFDILSLFLENNLFEDFTVRIIGGKDIPKRFLKFKDIGVEFLGHITDIQEKILESDIIIGAGRVAIESILNERPVIAVGETEYLGLINDENIITALSSNFGDIGNFKYPEININILKKDIQNAISLEKNKLFNLKERMFSIVNLKNIVDKIEKKYFSLYVEKKKWEIPVIMYHRVINSSKNEGVHGTYIYDNIFEKHLQYLKNNNYEVITFRDLKNISWRNRFNNKKKYIILTFDDGYIDNYQLAFPILKKFKFKATIFLMAESTYNEWDVRDSNEIKIPLMTLEMIKEMQEYGIEFGAHTFNHPKINKISDNEIEYQIIESKKVIEDKIGKDVITFAYPYGILNEYAKKMAKKAGYDFAVSTDSGSVCISDDLYQIRRIAIFPNTNLFSFKRKVKGNYNFKKIKRENKKNGRK